MHQVGVPMMWLVKLEVNVRVWVVGDVMGIESLKHLRKLGNSGMTWYEIFMSDFEFTAYLVDDEHQVTVAFKVASVELMCDLLPRY